MNKEEIISAIALTNKVINNPTMPEAVKEVATKKRADLQKQLDAMGGSKKEVETEKVVETTIEKEVVTPKKEKIKVERKPRTPKAPTPKKETETPESTAEKSMEGKKLSVANCRELLAKLKTRREGAKKRVATRKKQGKPAELTTIEVLKKTSDTLETKVQTEVNKQGKLQKTTIKRSTKEVVDIVATIVSGIPTKAERTEYINEVIADLKKLIDKVEPITEKMAKGGMTKDFSGNYYSTNDFVGSNGLKDLANEVFGKGWKAEDDVDQIAELANHSGLKYVVIYAENRSEWNKYRQIDTAHPTSDSNYDIFVIANEDWKKYVNDSEGDSDYDDEEYEKGGELNQKGADSYANSFMLDFDKTRRLVGAIFGKNTRKEFEQIVKSKFSKHQVMKFGGMMAKGGIFSKGPLEFKDSIQGSDGNYTYNLTFQPINNISKLYIQDDDSGKSSNFFDINYSIIQSFAQEFQDLMDEHEDEFTETDWSFRGEVKSAFHDDKKYGASCDYYGNYKIFIGDESATFKSGSLMQSLAESFIELYNKVGDKGYDDQEYAKGGMMAHGGMIDESTKNQIDKGFTKKSFNEILNELFPYNFGFKVFKPLNRQNILTPNYDEAPSSLYGYDDSQIKSKLHFDQYKRDHAINFAIEQGGENTYYYFLLGDEEGNEYVGTFGFKDQGDVDSSYVTRFIAFLMECYGLPFEVKHSVN
jgi:hypothetical protein